MSLETEAAYQIRKATLRLEHLAQRRTRLLERARDAAAVLREEFGARRVWLFGSLLRPWFHDTSDLDLAVEGIETARLGRAWDRASEIVGESVDLVNLEEAPDALRRHILDSGEVIE